MPRSRTRSWFPRRARLLLFPMVLALGAASAPPASAELLPLLLLQGSGGALSLRAKAIRRFANRWRGTPYRWGGTTRSGIDCSAYLRQMYRDLFGVELPRTTKQQIHLGVDLPISRRNLSSGLEPGDLIFYVNAAGVPNHVVIYAGRGNITHSVSGRGVVVDPIQKIYGRRVAARRLLLPGRSDGPTVGDGYAPIPAAGPLVTTEIPCPDSFAPRRSVVRKYRRVLISDFRPFKDWELCSVRALADALSNAPQDEARVNVIKLRAYAEWLDSLEALKGVLSEP